MPPHTCTWSLSFSSFRFLFHVRHVCEISLLPESRRIIRVLLLRRTTGTFSRNNDRTDLFLQPANFCPCHVSRRPVSGPLVICFLSSSRSLPKNDRINVTFSLSPVKCNTILYLFVIFFSSTINYFDASGRSSRFSFFQIQILLMYNVSHVLLPLHLGLYQ